jgi:predicted DNA-binding transcriptional regulator AlpA
MLPDNPENRIHQPWLTKHQLAEHLAVSDRWIELQQHVGLPYLRMGGIIRYRVSEVETWIRERYNSSTKSS